MLEIVSEGAWLHLTCCSRSDLYHSSCLNVTHAAHGIRHWDEWAKDVQSSKNKYWFEIHWSDSQHPLLPTVGITSGEWPLCVFKSTTNGSSATTTETLLNCSVDVCCFYFNWMQSAEKVSWPMEPWELFKNPLNHIYIYIYKKQLTKTQSQTDT